MKTKKFTRQCGQALTEFALVVPIFLALLFGALEFGRAVYQWHTLYESAKEGARAAAMSVSNKAADIQNVGKAATNNSLNARFPVKALTVTVPANLNTDPIRVHIESDFNSVVGTLIPPLQNVPLLADASAFYATLSPAGLVAAPEPPKPPAPPPVPPDPDRPDREKKFNDEVDKQAGNASDKQQAKDNFKGKSDKDQKDILAKSQPDLETLIKDWIDWFEYNRRYNAAYNEGYAEAWADASDPYTDNPPNGLSDDLSGLSVVEKLFVAWRYLQGVAQGYQDWAKQKVDQLKNQAYTEGKADYNKDPAEREDKLDLDYSVIDELDQISAADKAKYKADVNKAYKDGQKAGKDKWEIDHPEAEH